MKDLSLHPCFNEKAKHSQARVHLPVAPKCNIQCNYCNRLYDCCNESRPGVTSSVLSPIQASHYFNELEKKMDNLRVVGIAGPGDPFANPNETLATIELIERNYPEMIFCLSTNGLELAPYIDRIAGLNVSHVTITINSLNIETLSKIYAWVHFRGKTYKGREGARILLEQQLACIEQLKRKGMIVKINTVVIPGVNESEIGELAEKVAAMGADTMNCIPLYPTENTLFGALEEPSKEMMKNIKATIAQYIRPMGHCARCRSDAAGLLGHDDTEAISLIKKHAAMTTEESDMTRKNVAVATSTGSRVDLHIGEASEFWIFEQSRNGYRFIEKRTTAGADTCDDKWANLSKSAFSDCQAVLVSGAGRTPINVLQRNGIRVIQMKGLIDTGLDLIYQKRPIIDLCKVGPFKCGATCHGDQKGCG
ncbi:radical SAM protein [Parabacteroides sp. Marseille-P3160]|uniref:radical SAM protein n=1 Tax=Parabacteroides sp. Marseille-P3160 TaxID=1917887 RepID=UPI0009BBF026|nr:radical SAM protein [Parabacteroides sp. Marseille-P3160]